MWKSRKTRALLASAAVGLLALAGCTNSGGDSGGGDTGDSGSDKPSVALFYSEGNAFLTAANEGAKQAADELGIDLTLFNSNFDPQQQLNQLETAVTQGGFDAFVIAPLDGNLLCDFVTNTVLPDGIEVVTIQSPICARDTERGNDQVEPGAFAHITGQNIEIYEEWMSQIAERNDGGKVAVLSGPPLLANTINLAEAVKTLGSGFEVVANQTTDYTTPTAFAAAQTMLQANPDIEIFISNYTGVTQGIVEAVAAAGSSAKIYDFGGDQWALDAVESGTIAGTVMMLPATETKAALELVLDALAGGESPGAIDLTADPSLPGTAFVFAENVGDFTAEY